MQLSKRCVALPETTHERTFDRSLTGADIGRATPLKLRRWRWRSNRRQRRRMFSCTTRTTAGAAGGAPYNRLSRFTAQCDSAQPSDDLVLVELPPLSAATKHNGGALPQQLLLCRLRAQVYRAADPASDNAAYAFVSISDAPVDMLVGTDGALLVLGRASITRINSP